MIEIGLGHYLSLGAIIFFLASYKKIGTQSAVKIAIGSFFWLVITASAFILFLLGLNFLFKKTNLLLWNWFSKKIFFDFLLILFFTSSPSSAKVFL